MHKRNERRPSFQTQRLSVVGWPEEGEKMGFPIFRGGDRWVGVGLSSLALFTMGTSSSVCMEAERPCFCRSCNTKLGGEKVGACVGDLISSLLGSCGTFPCREGRREKESPLSVLILRSCCQMWG